MYVNRVEFEFLFITQSTAPFSIPPHAVPGAPPQLVKAYAESSTSIRVVWQPPPENKRNGRITYYKIFVVPDSRPDSEAAEIDITKDPDSARESSACVSLVAPDRRPPRLPSSESPSSSLSDSVSSPLT